MRRFLASGICVLAGAYIFFKTGTWTSIIAYGMAIYFIGKGIAVYQTLTLGTEIRDLLARATGAETQAPTDQAEDLRKAMESWRGASS